MIARLPRARLAFFLILLGLLSTMWRPCGVAAQGVGEEVSLREELRQERGAEITAAQSGQGRMHGERELLKAMAGTAVSSAPVNPYYIIGPSDQIIVKIWGKKTETFNLLVDENGFATLPTSGGDVRVSLNGLYFKDLKTKFVRELAELHDAIDPEHPEKSETHVDVTLGEIRGINIMVLGEVKTRGNQTLNTTISSVFNVLAKAGGITPNGSLRKLIVRRPGDTTEQVDLRQFDLYSILMTGNLDEALFHLQDGDVLIVPPKQHIVTIEGEVKRPGTYELLPEETLGFLVEMAGGLTPESDATKVRIWRFKGERGTTLLMQNLVEEDDFVLLDGDRIEVVAKAVTRRLPMVEIKGDGVMQPGEYEYTEGMTLAGLVDLGGGFYDDALLDTTVLVRTQRDFSLEFVTVNLEEELAKTDGGPLVLQPMDKLIVYSKFFKQGGDKYVTIRGYVKEPGKYLRSTQMKLSDLIYMAGGFGDKDFLQNAYLERADLVRKEAGGEVSIPFDLGRVLDGDPDEDHLLQNNDVVQIFNRREIEGERTVTISGHVRHPKTYPLRREMRVSELLFLGGGFKDPDFIRDTWLERADLVRIDPVTHQRRIQSVDLRKVLEGDAQADVLLQGKDHLHVYAFEDLQDRRLVTIGGEVRNPGEYEMTESMTLTDLVSLANGLTDLAAPTRIEIARFPEADASGDQAAQQLLVALRGGDVVYLESNDRVMVRRKAELREKSVVTVSGLVAYPGEYVLISRTETLSDIVERAGGFVQGASPEAARLSRRCSLVPRHTPDGVFPTNEGGQTLAGSGKMAGAQEDYEPVSIDLVRALQNPKGPYDLVLLDGDTFDIPKQNWVVTVLGEVAFPKTVQYVDGASVRHYIDYVGGYTSEAQRRDTVVAYPNGEVKRVYRGWFRSTAKVQPGSTIMVPDELGVYYEPPRLFPSLVLAGPLDSLDLTDGTFPEDRLDHPAFAPVEDKPKLPRVLLIGDAISVGYTLSVRALLEGKANVHRIPVAHIGSVGDALRQLPGWLGEGEWDVIHINLADPVTRSYMGLETDDADDEGLGDYERLLGEFVVQFKETGADLVWGATMCLPAEASRGDRREANRYAEVARIVMMSHGVAMDQLGAMISLNQESLQDPASAHCLPEGYEKLAPSVADSISRRLLDRSREQRSGLDTVLGR